METFYVKVVRASDGFTTLKEIQAEDSASFLVDYIERAHAVGCAAERATKAEFDDYNNKILEVIRNAKGRKQAARNSEPREGRGAADEGVSGDPVEEIRGV
jgi:hypothetical protein